MLDATGFRIPMGIRADLVAGLRAQLQAIAADPGALPAMAQAGQGRGTREKKWAAKEGEAERIRQGGSAGAEGRQAPPLPRE